MSTEWRAVDQIVNTRGDSTPALPGSVQCHASVIGFVVAEIPSVARS